MKEEKEKIISKIQKILIQAKDQENTPEGDTFKKHAALLMAKYRIKETEIDLETDSFTLDSLVFYHDGNRVPQWVSRIVYIFADTFDCKTIYREGWESTEHEFIGTFSDVETSVYFTEIVCNHIEAECFRVFPQKTYHKKRQQLGNVAASVIRQRTWELKQQMDSSIHEDKDCMALVVQKTEEVAEALAELYPKLRKTKGRKTDLPDDQKTWDAGRKAGETAPLNFAIEDAAAA